MKEKFIDHPFRPISRRRIALAHMILDQYEEQGYTLTLRQLYYQMVARNFIPNRQEEYKKLGKTISKARLSGLIDWSMIEDRLRRPIMRHADDNAQQSVLDTADLFHLYRWEGQENYLELWCEKDAVSNVFEPVCYKYDIRFMADRGYASQTAMYDAYNRIYRELAKGKHVTIIYFGDHDPSGIDMTRDIRDRLGLFLNGSDGRYPVEFVDRAALNMDQVEQYKPPENPAKVNDPRFYAYVERYGSSSWELDALEPSVLADLAESIIIDKIDFDIWNKIEEKEEEAKDRIRDAAYDL